MLFKEAEKSLRFYRNCMAITDGNDELLFQEEFKRFQVIANQNETSPKLKLSDFGIMINQ